MNTCPNCGKIAGLHSSILQGCMCQYSMQAPPQRTEQEPVAYWKEHAKGLQRDYDSLLADFQAQRSESSGKPSAWVELTNEELTDLFYNTNLGQQSAVAQAIALLKEKNS